MSTATLSRVSLDGVGFDALTEGEAVAAVRAALDRGEGGRIVTPNAFSTPAPSMPAVMIPGPAPVMIIQSCSASAAASRRAWS